VVQGNKYITRGTLVLQVCRSSTRGRGDRGSRVVQGSRTSIGVQVYRNRTGIQAYSLVQRYMWYM